MMKLNLTYILKTKFIACIFFFILKKKKGMGEGVGELFLHFNSFNVLVLLRHYNTTCAFYHPKYNNNNTTCATKLSHFLRIL